MVVTGTTGNGNEDCSLKKFKIDDILGARVAERLEDHLKTVRVVRGEEKKVGDQVLAASGDYRPQSGLSDADTFPDTEGNYATAFFRELSSFRNKWIALTPGQCSLLSDRALHPTTDWRPLLERSRDLENSNGSSPDDNDLYLASRTAPRVDGTRKFVTSDPAVCPVRTNVVQ